MTSTSILAAKQQYDRAVAAAESECQRELAPLHDEYDHAMTIEIKRYERFKDAPESIGTPAAKVCDNAMTEIRREFRRVAAPIRSRYHHAKTAAQAEYDSAVAEIREQERRYRIAAAARKKS
jgi:hypothetical protein